MGAATGLSVEEYLSAVYRPDRDYVDGAAEERNAGEFDHSLLQGLILVPLLSWADRNAAYALPEQRVQVRPERYRVPDLCLIHERDRSAIIRGAPILCVEILSPSDAMSKAVQRLDDYLAMGVPVCWVVDPESRRGFTYDSEGLKPVRDGVLRLPGTDLAVDLAPLFARL
jgi:Uma2 family endonuclease